MDIISNDNQQHVKVQDTTIQPNDTCKRITTISFLPLRWNEITDWLDYIYKIPPTDMYRCGIYIDLYNTYTNTSSGHSNVIGSGITPTLVVTSPEPVISPGSKTKANLLKQSLHDMILHDLYDSTMIKLPPPLDLVALDTILLFGYKYGYRCLGRAVTNYMEYLVKYRDIYHFQNIETYTNKSISNNNSINKTYVCTCFLMKNEDGSTENNEIVTIDDSNFLKYLVCIAYVLWNSVQRDILNFYQLLVNEMYATGSFLLKCGKRTVEDFNSVIGFRLSTHNKYMFEKMSKSQYLYMLKANYLIQQRYIDNPLVIKYVKESLAQKGNDSENGKYLGLD